MPLHPILALDHVINEYRDYLRTEFRAKDPGLREALERALDEPLFLAQEPFFQTHRPFRSGERWRELPIDPKLTHVMETRSRNEHTYLHQSEAITELLAPHARPVVVTTGTGSGKTEAFLLPVIQNAIEDAVRFKKAGLTAILVYPMNALANDQMLRIQEYLRDSGFSGTVTVARYDRGTRQAEREALRHNPPHIRCSRRVAPAGPPLHPWWLAFPPLRAPCLRTSLPHGGRTLRLRLRHRTTLSVSQLRRRLPTLCRCTRGRPVTPQRQHY